MTGIRSFLWKWHKTVIPPTDNNSHQTRDMHLGIPVNKCIHDLMKDDDATLAAKQGSIVKLAAIWIAQCDQGCEAEID